MKRKIFPNVKTILRSVFICEPNHSQMVYVPCMYMWMELRTCTAPSGNGLCTIRCKQKFVKFFCKHKGNCAQHVNRFFHVHEPHACCLFFAFFQYGLGNVCWVVTEHRNCGSLCVHLIFTENWFTMCLVSANCMQTAQHDQGARVCMGFMMGLLILSL